QHNDHFLIADSKHDWLSHEKRRGQNAERRKRAITRLGIARTGSRASAACPFDSEPLLTSLSYSRPRGRVKRSVGFRVQSTLARSASKGLSLVIGSWLVRRSY